VPDGGGDVSSGENRGAVQVASIAVLNPAAGLLLSSVLSVRVFRMQMLVQMEARRATATGEALHRENSWLPHQRSEDQVTMRG
jgi:hypothetical protein